MKVIVKLATLVPICFLAWLVTSSLMAQNQRRTAPVAIERSKAPAAETVAEIDETTRQIQPVVNNVTEVQAAQLPKKPTLPENAVAIRELTALDAHVVDGMVNVTAQASMADRRRGIPFIWRLSLLDANGNTLDSILYDRQVFYMEADGEMQPNFSELCNLVPDTVAVQLSMFSFPEDTDLAILRDPVKSRAYLVVQGVRPLQ